VIKNKHDSYLRKGVLVRGSSPLHGSTVLNDDKRRIGRGKPRVTKLRESLQ